MSKIVAPKKEKEVRKKPHAAVPQSTSPTKRQVKTQTKNKDTPAPIVDAVHYEKENPLDYDIIPGEVPDTILDKKEEIYRRTKAYLEKKEGGQLILERDGNVVHISIWIFQK